jgi:peptidoglycan/xylan/chitin deacetylase (PgdA/CDA1 family)
LALVLSGAALLLTPVSTVPAQLAHAAGTNTVVTIGFDDSNADQFKMLKMLAAHGMNGTFFTNSGFVGTADHLTWGQLHQLYAAGNEIGGHTIDHANIKKLEARPGSPRGVRRSSRDLRPRLNPVSFAYPFGNHDAGSEAVVHDCGYNSGTDRLRRGRPQDVRGDDPAGRSVRDPDAAQPESREPRSRRSRATSYAAEQNGGGWVQYVFHHVCANNCDAYSITPWEMNNFLAWLQARAARGTVVETTCAGDRRARPAAGSRLGKRVIGERALRSGGAEISP